MIIAAIHVAKRDLGLEDDDYRSLLERVTGKASLRLMSTREQGAVLDELRAKGAPVLTVKGKDLAGPYAKKLQALWIAAWNLGIVRDRTDKAMLAFIARQTGIENTRFLRDPADARKAVEALKAWIARDGGVVWGTSQGTDWLAHDPGKIAWAQWRKLEPGATLSRNDKGFAAYVLKIVDGYVGQPLGTLRPAEWRLVMNALGKRLRKGGEA